MKNASEAYENVQYERLFVPKASWVRLLLFRISGDLAFISPASVRQETDPLLSFLGCASEIQL